MASRGARAALFLACWTLALHGVEQQTPGHGTSLGGNKIRCAQVSLRADELCSMIEQQNWQIEQRVVEIKTLEADNAVLQATTQQLSTKIQDLSNKESNLQEEVAELRSQVQQLANPQLCDERAPVKDENIVEQGGRRYLFTTSLTSWQGAEATCRSREMRLVGVDGSRDHEALLRAWQEAGSPEDTYWLSGNDLARRGEFRWGSSGRRFGYTRWKAGQPHPDPSFHCVGVTFRAGERGLWFTNDCDAKYYVLCEAAAKI